MRFLTRALYGIMRSRRGFQEKRQGESVHLGEFRSSAAGDFLGA